VLLPCFPCCQGNQRVGAVLVGNSNLYIRHAEQLTALAARHALPAIYVLREFVLPGGLMS